MTDTAVMRRYSRLRRENPTLGARDALRRAKADAKPLAFDWSVNPGRHVNAATTTQDGFDVRVVVDYDQYSDRRASYTARDTGIRNPDFDWNDGDEYLYRNNDRKRLRYIELESEYTVASLADDYNKQGMSKSVALDVARKSLEDEAREYLSDDWASYVVGVEVSIGGIELGTAGIGGVEVDIHGYEQGFESVVSEHGLIEEAIDEARQNMTHLLAAKEALDKMATV